MSVENLTRYDLSGEYDMGIDIVSDGNYVRFDEAVEASSSSLKQIKAEISVLADKLEKHTYDSHDLSDIHIIYKRLRELSAV